MQSIREDVIGGFNAFRDAQRLEAGSATLTLVQFDSQDPYEILHRFAALDQVPHLTRETYVPRASTPLLDAMGRGINDLESSLAQSPEDARPSRVVMVVITDGHENASREFRLAQIHKMIKDKREKFDWQFAFLSADLSAIEDARAVGIDAASSMTFDRNARGTASAWASTSSRVSDYRSGRSRSASYTPDDRSRQSSETDLA